MWSFSEMRLIARGEGHSSWVTAVAFDPWNCDSDEYRFVLRATILPLGLYIALSDSPVSAPRTPPRFGSVGLDQRLLLWNFSINNLHMPKLVCRAFSDFFNKKREEAEAKNKIK
jgi:hypothetical protein